METQFGILGKCNDKYKEMIQTAAAAAGDDPVVRVRPAQNQDQYLCSRFFSRTFHERKQSGDHGRYIYMSEHVEQD